MDGIRGCYNLNNVVEKTADDLLSESQDVTETNHLFSSKTYLKSHDLSLCVFSSGVVDFLLVSKVIHYNNILLELFCKLKTMITIATLAIILYLISWFLLTITLRSRLAKTATLVDKKVYLATWSVAILLHAIVLYYPLWLNGGLTLSMIVAASHIIWLTSLVLLITTWTRKIEALGVFILPLTAFTFVLQQMVSLNTGEVIQIHNGLGVHIFSSLLAYSMLMLASIQAALLAEQNNHLHNHKPTGFIRVLPSLQDMESLLFRFVTLGVILLSIALMTGFIFVDDLLAQHIAHKTILSLIAWFIFATLLFGHLKFGWRGRTAIRWTLAGFVMLMIAFFGTKLIQHFLLGS